jgi:hypothetical protein
MKFIIMENQLTWGDAEKYYLGERSGNQPQLPPERLALIEADLSKGKDSLVVQYMILRGAQLARVSEAFHSLSPVEAMKQLTRIRSKRSTSHAEAGQRYEMPLTQRIDELRREAEVAGNLPETQRDGDFHVNRGYDKGPGGMGRG